MYAPHPSRGLHDLFALKPYQGAEPHEADFLFVGLDANYDERIELTPTFSKILEYHSDGVAFWRKYGVHHPFLLPGYSGDVWFQEGNKTVYSYLHFSVWGAFQQRKTAELVAMRSLLSAIG